MQVKDGSSIQAFMQETIAPSRVIVSAVGVEHKRLVDMASAALESMKASSPKEPAASTYQGGEFYIPGPLDMGEVSTPCPPLCLAHDTWQSACTLPGDPGLSETRTGGQKGVQ